ncbi:MAG: Gfo/Idh/MocA family oxidoreductase, partial [Bacteroidota bacterium]|nr:Gfo/Idh/MocA family oxidoreductase [Bacteroidota bacterium]
FAPLVMRMRAFFEPVLEPFVIHYYVNAGFLPKDHWTHDPVEGGGRIIGEMCHFIDTVQYLTGAMPLRLSAECIATDNEAATAEDNLSVTLRMSDGSVANIIYTANGDPSFPKERIIASNAGATAVMNNFTILEMYRNGKRSVAKSPGDKGHANEVRAFIDAIKQKRTEVIPFTSMVATTRATFRIRDALHEKRVIELI